MKKFYSFLFLAVFSPIILSCGSSTAKSVSSEATDNSTAKEGTSDEGKVSFTVKGVTFTMILVKGGTFTMGATPEQGKDADKNEKPAHEVTLSDYTLGRRKGHRLCMKQSLERTHLTRWVLTCLLNR